MQRPGDGGAANAGVALGFGRSEQWGQRPEKRLLHV